MTVTVHQAKTHLSRLLNRVEQGEEILVCRGKQPVAKIISSNQAKPARPKVGNPTSPRFVIPAGAFLPLRDDELAEWGT